MGFYAERDGSRDVIVSKIGMAGVRDGMLDAEAVLIGSLYACQKILLDGDLAAALTEALHAHQIALQTLRKVARTAEKLAARPLRKSAARG